MAFRKRGEFNDNNRSSSADSAEDNPGRSDRLSIGNAAYKQAYSWSGGVFSILVILFCIFRQSFLLEQEDVIALATIMLTLSTLVLAIFTFLKDTGQKSRYEFQLFTIAISGTLATFLGILSFLYTRGGETNVYPITVTFIFGVVWVFAINIHFLTALFPKRTVPQSGPFFSTRGLAVFGTTVALMCISSLLGKGSQLLIAFIVLSLYSFILLFILFFSMTLQLLKREPGTNIAAMDLLTQQTIESILLGNAGRAYTEDELMLALRSHPVFRNTPDLISRTRVTQDLVYHMDSEQRQGFPKLSIHKGKVVPRWQPAYSVLLANVDPMVWVKWSYASNCIESEKEYYNNIYAALNDNLELSEELLKEYNAVQKKYKVFRGKFLPVGLVSDLRLPIYYIAFVDKGGDHEWENLRDLPSLLALLIKWHGQMGRMNFEQLGYGSFNENPLIEKAILLDILFQSLEKDPLKAALDEWGITDPEDCPALILKKCNVRLDDFGIFRDLVLNEINEICD